MGVLSKLTSDAINESLGVSKVFLDKNFEVKPHDKSDAFVAVFILSLSKANIAMEI